MPLSEDEILGLAARFHQPPFDRYRGWTFDFEYPGHFVYYHRDIPLRVYFTPEFSAPGEVDVQVHSADDYVEGASWPFTTGRAEDLFAIVRQWLDRIESQKAAVSSVKNWFPESPARPRP